MASKKVISIEIGQNHIRALEMTTGKNVVVHGAVQFDTPERCYNDGYLTDTAVLGELLRDKLDEAGMKAKQVVFTVVSNKVMSRETTVPIVKKNQLKALIRDEAEDKFPVELDDYILSHVVLSVDKEAKQQTLMLYAVPEDLVEEYYELAAFAGLTVKAIDCIGNSSYNWMHHSMPDSKSMMVQIGMSTTMTTIVTDDILRMQRKINYGIDEMLEAAKEAGLGLDTAEAYEVLCRDNHLNRFLPGHISSLDDLTDEERAYYQKTVEVGDGVSKKLTEEEALRIAEEVQVNYRSMTDGELAETNKAVTEASRQLITNIQRIVEYYTQKNREDEINTIVLVGFGSSIKGLQTLLENELGIAVITVNDLVDDKLTNSLRAVTDDPGIYVALSGAPLAPVGFVPQTVEDGARRSGDVKLLLRILIAVAILCAVLILNSLFGYLGEKRENARLMEEKDSLSYITAIYDEYQHSYNVNAEVKAIDESTVIANEKLNKLFAELERYLPSSTVISSMTSSGDTVTMSMSVASKETAAKLLMQLQEVDYLDDVMISGITEDSDSESGSHRVQFALTCYFADEMPEDEDTQPADGASPEAGTTETGEVQ